MERRFYSPPTQLPRNVVPTDDPTTQITPQHRTAGPARRTQRHTARSAPVSSTRRAETKPGRPSATKTRTRTDHNQTETKPRKPSATTDNPRTRTTTRPDDFQITLRVPNRLTILGSCTLDGVRRVVVSDRAAVAGSAGAARDPVRSLHRYRWEGLPQQLGPDDLLVTGTGRPMGCSTGCTRCHRRSSSGSPGPERVWMPPTCERKGASRPGRARSTEQDRFETPPDLRRRRVPLAVTLTGGKRKRHAQPIHCRTRSRRSAAGVDAHDASPMSWWPTVAMNTIWPWQPRAPEGFARWHKHRTVSRQRAIRPLISGAARGTNALGRRTGPRPAPPVPPGRTL
jgi:hypothetical protein